VTLGTSVRVRYVATMVHERILETESNGSPMAVVHTGPDGGAERRVVVFHDGPGLRASTHEFAAKLATEGYEVMVPDLYHHHGRLIGFEPSDVAADPHAGSKIWTMISSLTDASIQADLDAALAVVGWTDADRLGCIGFCLGARAVFRTMMRLPGQFAAGAMWHPSFLADDQPDSPHLTAPSLANSLFVGIGDADEVQSIAMHQRFFDAVGPLAHVSVEIFEGADHGFTWPVAPTYHEEAATRCFAETTRLFSRQL